MEGCGEHRFWKKNWVVIDCMTSGWQRLLISVLSATVPLSKPAPRFCQQQSHNGNEIDINYWLVALECPNTHQNWFHRDTNLWLSWSTINWDRNSSNAEIYIRLERSWYLIRCRSDGKIMLEGFHKHMDHCQWFCWLRNEPRRGHVTWFPEMF